MAAPLPARLIRGGSAVLAAAWLACAPGGAAARMPHTPANDPLQAVWQRPKAPAVPVAAPPACVDEEPPGQPVLDAAAGGDEAVARLAREHPADALRCSDLFPGAAATEALLGAARLAPFDAVGAIERLTLRPGGAAIVDAALDPALLERALDDGLPFYQTRHELNRRLPPAALRVLEGRAARLLAVAFRRDPLEVSGQIGILLDDMSEDHPADRFRIALGLPADSLFELIAHAGPQLYTSSLDGLVNVLRIQLKQEKRSLLELARAPSTRALWAKFFVAVVSSGRGRDLFDSAAGDVRELARVSVAAVLAFDHGVAPPIVAGALADAMDVRSIPARAALEDEVAAFHRTTSDAQVRSVAGLAGGLHVMRLAGRPASPTFVAERFGDLYPLPPLPALTEERLFERGVNWQRMTFYDDRDGRSSFRSFVQQRRALGWAINDHGGFITVASPERRGRRIVIIADIPGSGDAGRTAVRAWIAQHGVTPTIVIHRGHSYHEDGTMSEIAAQTALVFWGSCGGHVRLSGTLAQAPDAQVLATQNMGISTINHALLRIIEERLLNSGSLDWAGVWADAQAQIHDRRFGAYRRPDQDSTNLALRGWRMQTERLPIQALHN